MAHWNSNMTITVRQGPAALHLWATDRPSVPVAAPTPCRLIARSQRAAGPMSPLDRVVAVVDTHPSALLSCAHMFMFVFVFACCCRLCEMSMVGQPCATRQTPVSSLLFLRKTTNSGPFDLACQDSCQIYF